MPGWPARSFDPDALCAFPEQGYAVRFEAEGGKEIVDTVKRKGLVDRGEKGAPLVGPASQRQATGGDRSDMRMRVRAGGGLDAPLGSLIEPFEAHQGHRPRAEHGKEHRIERAQVTRVVGGSDGRSSIARLRVNESKGVMGQGKVRAQVDRPIQLEKRLVLPAA